jgi:hypothetical protein
VLVIAEKRFSPLALVAVRVSLREIMRACAAQLRGCPFFWNKVNMATRTISGLTGTCRPRWDRSSEHWCCLCPGNENVDNLQYRDALVLDIWHHMR